MEVYPEKMDGTLHGPLKNCYSYYLSFELRCIIMSEIQFDVNVANGVTIDVLPVWWMERYPFPVNQSKSLLYVEIKWFTNQQKI